MLGHEAVYLAAHPRKISLVLIGHLIVAQRNFQYGFVPFVLGAALLCHAFPVIKTAVDLRGPTASADGVLTSSRDTGRTSGLNAIYENRYFYVASDGTRHSGVSYGRPVAASAAANLPVIYSTDSESISVISGMSATTTPPWFASSLLLPFGAGLVMLAIALLSAFRNFRIVRFGQLGTARLIAKEESKKTVNQHPVYDYVYEFSAHGEKTAVLKVSTFEWLDDNQSVLYFIAHPSQCVLICAIPGKAAVTDAAATARDPLFPSLLIPMTATVIALAIAVALQ
jgi:hypothetical protein